MTPEPSFESLSYKPFSVDGNLTVNVELDLDVNFSQNISSLDTQCQVNICKQQYFFRVILSSPHQYKERWSLYFIKLEMVTKEEGPVFFLRNTL